jgi:arylsulfatase A-like enzyme
VFPHPLAGKPGTADERFYDLWERSPYSDAMLGEMASTLVQTMQLGKRGVVDLLGVSFSALDYVGHDFGPNSHEVQDTLVRLDRTIGRFLAALDTTIGRDGYTLGLSADHGVGDIPEAAIAAGRDAGRLLGPEVRKIAEDAMVKAHGPGPHVAHVEYTELYLTEPARKRAAANPATLQPLIDALSKQPGVLRVIPTAGLEHKRTSSDPIERAAALGYFPGESGDVEVLLKQNWINSESSAATHGTLHPYDRHVPVLFFGKGIREGRYRDAASPADLAPTLASIVKLPMPGVDGTILRSAVK